MEDRVQAALNEAQQYIDQLGDDDDGVGDTSSTPAAFSIDSDGEDDDGELVEEAITTSTTSHPLEDAFLNTTTSTTATVATATNEFQPSSMPPQSTVAAAPAAGTPVAYGNHPLSNVPPPQQQPLPTAATPLQMSQQPQPPHTTTTSFSTGAAHVGGSPASAPLDSWRQQTSRFASNLANMAQRAANQVVIGTSTTPVSTNGSAAPFSGAATPSPILASAASFSSHISQNQYSPSILPSLSSSPMGVMQQQQPPQQHPMGMEAFMPDLDQEQKTALIQTHVGDLLPGERVIMFVSNLLHVSDSSGFTYSHELSRIPTANSLNNPYNNNGSSATQWCCAMTYYRLVLFGTHPIRPPPRPADWHPSCWPNRSPHVIQLPLACMEKVEKSVFASGTTTLMGLLITSKLNARQVRFTTHSHADTVRAHEALQTYAFPGRRNLGYLFAFESKKNAVMQSVQIGNKGEKVVTLPPFPRRFDGVQEFTRQFSRGSDNKNTPWTIYPTLNAQYQLCASYPSVLAGPATLDESNPEAVRILQQSAAFRSEQRLPALTWAAGSHSGASLWRSAQPKVGLQGNRSTADEWFLQHIAKAAAAANALNSARSRPPNRQVLQQLTGSTDLSHWIIPSYATSGVGGSNNLNTLMNGSAQASSATPTAATSTVLACELKILDLRPRSSAMANRTAGYGYENTSHYAGTTMQFCGIGNIHAVRDSYQKLSALCNNASLNDQQWTTALEETKWLGHVRTILAASWETAYWLHVWQLPVLLHCSHGWDRTSQVAVIAQIMLDPYYRTVRGIACLIEKDFCGFGHPFHTRCAHGEGGESASKETDEGQISPIFIQFLDCLYQLVAQYPEAFEYNTRYVLELSQHIYSCRFGNFLCDTEREREAVAGLRQRTHSVWDYLDGRPETRNPGFDSTANVGALLMPLPCLLRNVHLWTDRHCRYAVKATTRWYDPRLRPPLPHVANSSSLSPEHRHEEDPPAALVAALANSSMDHLPGDWFWTAQEYQQQIFLAQQPRLPPPPQHQQQQQQKQPLQSAPPTTSVVLPEALTAPVAELKL